MEYLRMLDANCNRACEGLRVCEDWLRFCKDNRELSAECRSLRHQLREIAGQTGCVFSRDSEKDVGKTTSARQQADGRATTRELLEANAKRAEEALRVIEETLKRMNRYPLAKRAEQLRFAVYTMEKQLLALAGGRAERLRRCGLYGITAEKYSRGRSNEQVVRQMLEAGVQVIQYREKGKKAGEKYAECVRLRRMTAAYDALFIVDDDVDIALACGADGVHIGQDDLPIERARELMGDRIIGLSTHSPEQAQDAVRRGADYIGVGPIFETHTKTDVCAPVGLSYLEYVVQNINLPFVAIGGIKQHTIAEVAKRGAGCICLVTGIVGAEEIPAAIAAAQQEIKANQ